VAVAVAIAAGRGQKAKVRGSFDSLKFNV